MSEGTFDRTALGSEAGALLEALLDLADDEGRTQASIGTLMKASGLTEAALARARSMLTQNLLLRTEPGYSSSGRRGANIYTLSRAVLEPAFPDIMEGESGQTGTGEASLTLAPAVPPVPEGSRHRKVEAPGFWSRLFRNSKAS